VRTNVCLPEDNMLYDLKELKGRFTHATMISPFLQKAGITLNMVDIPYEYRMESGVPRKLAIFASQSRWTSASVPRSKSKLLHTCTRGTWL
jgi:hypothetical protein